MSNIISVRLIMIIVDKLGIQQSYNVVIVLKHILLLYPIPLYVIAVGIPCHANHIHRMTVGHISLRLRDIYEGRFRHKNSG